MANHPVDGRTAAEAASAHMGTQLLSPRTPGLESLPLERGARRLVQRAPSVEAPELRRRLARTPVWSGLEKDNLASGILAQAGGEHAPGAAAADDDDPMA